MNDAFAKGAQQVIIYFFVKSHRAIYGVASLQHPINMMPAPYSPLIYGRTIMISLFEKMILFYAEFPIRWLHTMRASIRMVSQIKLTSGSASVLGKSAHDGRISNAEKQGGCVLFVL